MNKDRRNRLRDIADALDDAIWQVQEIIDEEQDAFDNMPEGLQNSAKGDSMMNTIDAMDDIVFNISEIRNKVEDLITD